MSHQEIVDAEVTILPDTYGECSSQAMQPTAGDLLNYSVPGESITVTNTTTTTVTRSLPKETTAETEPLDSEQYDFNEAQLYKLMALMVLFAAIIFLVIKGVEVMMAFMGDGLLIAGAIGCLYASYRLAFPKRGGK